MHPYLDGNGRTNIYGIMNKCLIEEGFCPAILPDGPEVFGGLKTLNGLVHDMLQGMLAFIYETRKHTKQIDTAPMHTLSIAKQVQNAPENRNFQEPKPKQQSTSRRKK